jgi:hypothetical protein
MKALKTRLTNLLIAIWSFLSIIPCVFLSAIFAVRHPRLAWKLIQAYEGFRNQNQLLVNSPYIHKDYLGTRRQMDRKFSGIRHDSPNFGSKSYQSYFSQAYLDYLAGMENSNLVSEDTTERKQ